MKSPLLFALAVTLSFHSTALAQKVENGLLAEPPAENKVLEQRSSSPADAAHFRVGGVSFAVPAPTGMVYFSKKDSPEIYKFMQANQPPGNTVQALFYIPEELELMKQGKLKTSTRHAMIYTAASASRDFSLEQFAKVIKPEIHQMANGEKEAEMNELMSEMQKKRDDLKDMNMDFSGFKPVHDEGPRHIACSFSMQNAEQGGMLGGTLCVMLVKARPLCLGIYEDAPPDNKTGIRKSREAATSWAKEVVKANPASAAEALVESAPYESSAYAAGKTVGTLCMLILVVGFVILLVRKLRE
jgi:hypothetical protein